MVDKVAEENDLGHPLAANLRSGNWLMEYISGRLKSRLYSRHFRGLDTIPAVTVNQIQCQISAVLLCKMALPPPVYHVIPPPHKKKLSVTGLVEG